MRMRSSTTPPTTNGHFFGLLTAGPPLSGTGISGCHAWPSQYSLPGLPLGSGYQPGGGDGAVILPDTSAIAPTIRIANWRLEVHAQYATSKVRTAQLTWAQRVGWHGWTDGPRAPRDVRLALQQRAADVGAGCDVRQWHDRSAASNALAAAAAEAHESN
jgi:hypothetical protein